MVKETGRITVCMSDRPSTSAGLNLHDDATGIGKRVDYPAVKIDADVQETLACANAVHEPGVPHRRILLSEKR